MELQERTIFISYSWTTEELKTWVRKLAERLEDNCVNVKLDQWDLKAGHDKYAFMESMVQDESIDKVLIICDEKYAKKANMREGGVGTETQIITPEVYNKVTQEKFIPIIVEKGESFESYLPSYLKSRIAVDMSSDEVYEEGYEQLLRLIYDKPQYKRPAKGNPPAFLFTDEKTNFKTTNLNNQLKHFLLNKPTQADYIINEFIEAFLSSLEQFNIECENCNEPYDEQIYSNIENMLELRNDYINFLLLLCRLKKDFDIEIIINLFENLYKFSEYQGNMSYKEIQFDHYKFFITELFLYTSVLLIEHEMFESLNLLLSTKYFVKSKHIYGENGIIFSYFRFYISSLDEYRKKRLGTNRISITADLLVDRTKINGKDYKEKLLEADLLLHYVSTIKYMNDNMKYWFPMTYIYRRERSMQTLQKMARKQHFEKVKILFNVDTIDEMKELLKNYKIAYKGYGNSFESIPNMIHQTNIDEIGKY